MASTYEKQADGQIIYKPANMLDVPNLDLMTLIFESEICRVPDDTVLHVDAAQPSHNLTKAQLRTGAKRVAHNLRHQYGIGASGPGKDIVFNMSTGNFLSPIIFYAIITAGGIYSSTSPSSTPNEFAFQLRQTDSKLIFCTADVKETALAAAKLVGLPEKNVLVYGGTNDLELQEAASGANVPISNTELDWQRITDPVELENSVLCLLFSSGTTGLPKAVRLSQRNIVASCTLTFAPIRKHVAATKPKGFRGYFAAVTIGHLPIAHVAGVQGYVINSTYQGGICYWMRKFDFPNFCEYARKYKATTMLSVPSIYLMIAKSPLVKDHFDTWEDAQAGTAPMGQELQLAVTKKLGKGTTILRQTWGLSETCGGFTTTPIALIRSSPPGSVGALKASCYARLVDDNEKDVEPGQPGEIWVKGPTVTKGYWKNDKANQESFKDGWFCTGDIGIFRDGFFFIVDRKKELIKYKGIQVAPAELEAVLITHPKILDAAVIGVQGDGTEVPRAYVVVADRKEITGPEIVEWLANQGLAHYKRLRGGVAFIDVIPRSQSGKILRRELRELAKKETPKAKL